VLDEPVAMLDPVARHDFMATVLAAASDGVSVLLSSHVLTELERARLPEPVGRFRCQRHEQRYEQ
jgi:ABC-type multidrug transport system ATPase subunit